jgi:deoxyribodipyrimidine photolyase
LPKFDHDRAKIDRESTSKLSPYIHTGEISVSHLPISHCF